MNHYYIYQEAAAIGDGHHALNHDLADDDIAYLEALYRGRGRVERRICDAKDTTPPEITVPAAVLEDASACSGATVNYSVTVTDNHDPNPALSCAPPSGSTFPIGDSTVLCHASDASGNTASASFTVHVRDASEQLDTLIGLAQTFGAKAGTVNKLTQAKKFIAEDESTQAGKMLDLFEREVNGPQNGGLSAAQKAALSAAAGNVRALLDC